MNTAPAAPDPDDKDWTWVLQRACPDCGFDAGSIARDRIAGRLLAATPRWQDALRDPAVAVRPGLLIWSILEYACHIRDVHALFNERAQLIQGVLDPLFANWDQDETALRQRYWEADPAQVSAELEQRCQAAAAAFSGLSDDQWERPGRRSNGSIFTMETLGLYYLHDVEHHLQDVGF